MLRLISLFGTLVAASFALAFSACSKAPSADVSTPVVLTETQSGHTVSVPVGGTVEIKLKGNLTTGYTWSLASQQGDSVAPQGEMEYVVDANPDGAVGVGGTAIFRFQAQKAGKTSLQFAYARPWENGAAPAQTYAATIEVK